MSAIMVGWQRNIFKLHWLKCPETVPKNNLGQKINDSKPHIWSLPINFRFSSRKSQSQQNLAKKITHFTIQFHPKNLTHFTNMNSLKISKNILPKHSQKPNSLQKFSRKIASCWCQKKYLHFHLVGGWIISLRLLATWPS